MFRRRRRRNDKFLKLKWNVLKKPRLYTRHEIWFNVEQTAAEDCKSVQDLFQGRQRGRNINKKARINAMSRCSNILHWNHVYFCSMNGSWYCYHPQVCKRTKQPTSYTTSQTGMKHCNQRRRWEERRVKGFKSSHWIVILINNY